MDRQPVVRLRRCYVRRSGDCLRLIVCGVAVPDTTFPLKLMRARRSRYGARGDAITAATMTAAAAEAGVEGATYNDFLDALQAALGQAAP